MANGSVFAVADGMGGHVGGEVASRIAIERIAAHEEDQEGSWFNDVFVEANSAILLKAERDSALHGMGTTLTAAYFHDSEEDPLFTVQSIGDSRAYLWTDGVLHQVTDDHTYVRELIRSGSISEDEGLHHRGRHILTRALGREESVEVDTFTVRVRSGDRLLLCSDGLYNHVVDSTIAQLLGADLSASEVAERLVSFANDDGGSDNISVVVVQVFSDGERVGRHRRLTAQMPGDLDDRSSGVGTKVRRNPIARGPVLTSIPRPLDRRVVGDKGRIVTVRMVSFMAVLLVFVLSVGLLVNDYANHAYFLDVKGDRVVIYQGHPGGVLWFQPKLVVTTALKVSSLDQAQSGELRRKVEEPTLSAARNYLHNLQRNLYLEKKAKTIATVPSTTSTTISSSTSTTGAG
jgi:protein phosphatase